MNVSLQLTSLIKEMMNRMQRTESDVQVGFNAIQENMKKTMIETAEAFGVADPRQVNPFVSQCSPEGDRLAMKTHEAARDVMKEKCPHLKIGLSLSLHDMQWQEGGSKTMTT